MNDRRSSLEALSLSVGYKEGKQPVADNLSLKLEPGELVSLLGPNGAGKSTLIRTLAGIDDPLGGKIWLNGRLLSELTPKQRARQVSIVLTDSLPGPMILVYSLVALGRHPYTGLMGGLDKDDKSRIEWAIEAMGIQDLATCRFGEISDGERQKALIARALAQESDVLLLDEPTAYVDLPRRVEIVSVLRDLAHSHGMAILASSHDLELSLGCADKLWLMDLEGTLTIGVPEDLVLQGSIAKLFRSESFDWNSELGGFQVHRTPVRFARIRGEGEAYRWTRRALERMGFGVRNDGSVELELVVGLDAAGDPLYQVIFRGISKSFADLEGLFAWVQENEKSDVSD